MNLREPPERLVAGIVGISAILILAALRPDLDAGLLLGAITAIIAGLGVYEAAYKREAPERYRSRDRRSDR